MHQRCISTCVLLLTLAALTACQAEPQPTARPTPLPTPTPSLTAAEAVAREFLRAWQGGAYSEMYGLLSAPAMANISADKFVARYEAIAAEATMTGVTASINAVQRTAVNTAVITFTLTVDTQLVGQFQVENELNVSHDGQRWGVDWTPEAIFPLLGEEKLVHMFVHVPARASIYDRSDVPLATEGKVVELGVVPGQILDEAQLLDVLASVLGLPQDAIQAKYASAVRPDWFMPVGEISSEEAEANEALLSSVAGITWRENPIRIYPQGSVAAHIIGYMAYIDAEALARLAAEGYEETDMLGVTGLEAWGESHLAGARGGTLAIISPDGRIVWTLAERPAKESSSIYTTLRVDLQRAVEGVLGQRIGAIAVLDPGNGDVLALASYPRYDPGQLTAGAPSEVWTELLNDERYPFLNRAIAGLYPPGSTFKIVTMSAGLQELGLTENSSFYCAGRWDGVADGATRYCWVRSGHGTLNLFNGLAQSCDTVFWEVGKALNEHDPYALSRYATGFGLGKESGLNALGEAAGLVPDPDWKAQHYSGAEQQWLPRDAVNMAIGQGDVLATPLQLANLVAAVANGGTLYRPRLVRQIGSAEEGAAQQMPAEIMGQLPISAANLQIVRRAMEAVVTQGTAQRAFYGASVRMAGKSGTSEVPSGETHALFIGYAPADDPQIAVAVVLEHGGEGGADAAPLFRQVVEAYVALPQR